MTAPAVDRITCREQWVQARRLTEALLRGLEKRIGDMLRAAQTGPATVTISATGYAFRAPSGDMSTALNVEVRNAAGGRYLEGRAFDLMTITMNEAAVLCGSERGLPIMVREWADKVAREFRRAAR